MLVFTLTQLPVTPTEFVHSIAQKLTAHGFRSKELTEANMLGPDRKIKYGPFHDDNDPGSVWTGFGYRFGWTACVNSAFTVVAVIFVLLKNKCRVRVPRISGTRSHEFEILTNN